MADRYWVGGTGGWYETARWAASSGGAGGQSVPGSGDNVFFDANSHSSSYVVDLGGASRASLNLNIGNPSSGSVSFIADFVLDLSVYGNLYLGPGFVGPENNSLNIKMRGTGSHSIEAADGLSNPIQSLGALGSGVYTFLSDFRVRTGIQHDSGTLDFNGHTVKALSYTGAVADRVLTSSSPGGVFAFAAYSINPTMNIHRNSNLTFSNIDNWEIRFESPGTIAVPSTEAGPTPRIVFDPSATGQTLSFDVNASSSSGRNLTIDKLVVPNPPQTISFSVSNNASNPGKITIVKDFDSFPRGAPSNLVTFSRTGTQTWKLAKSGGGYINTDHINISNCAATPGSTWYVGSNSTDGGGNSGLIFSSSPAIEEDVDESANAADELAIPYMGWALTQAEAGGAEDELPAPVIAWSLSEALTGDDEISGTLNTTTGVEEIGDASVLLVGTGLYPSPLVEAGDAEDELSSVLSVPGAMVEIGFADDVVANTTTFSGLLFDVEATADVVFGEALLNLDVDEEGEVEDETDVESVVFLLVEEAEAQDVLDSYYFLYGHLVDVAAPQDTIFNSNNIAAGPLAETLNSTDAWTLVLRTLLSVSESSSIADTLAGASGSRARLTEGVSSLDALTGSAQFTRRLNEFRTLVDTLVAARVQPVTLGELASAVGVPSAVALFTSGLLEAPSAVDLITSERAFAGDLVEGLSSVELIASSAIFVGRLSDLGTAIEMVHVTVQLNDSLDEAALALDLLEARRIITGRGALSLSLRSAGITVSTSKAT